MGGPASRQVRLFLIRHGETVDNVASVYAGRRDSELTNHGHQQATRLGQYFASQGVVFSHIFSSDLQRAAKTAAQIRKAQVTLSGTADDAGGAPQVVQLPLLVEQDFGVYEGKKWYETPPEPGSVESKDSMSQRADAFLDDHLLPLAFGPATAEDHVIAVVSHGIMLSVLWKRLLLRLPQRSVDFAVDVLASIRGYSLNHLGAWSNTGYLELHFTQTAARAPVSVPPPASGVAPLEAVVQREKIESCVRGASDEAITDNVIGAASADSAISSPEPVSPTSPRKLSQDWLTVIKTVNGRDHLKALKRTRGGVGSARHDPSQKSIDSFFKKPRVE